MLNPPDIGISRFLIIVLLVAMLGSASICSLMILARPCATDIQSDEHGNYLDTTITRLETGLERLEDSFRGLLEAAAEGSPPELVWAIEDFDQSTAAYYDDSSNLEESAFHEMASLKADSLEAVNLKSLILDEKNLDISIAVVYTVVAYYYEENETAQIVGAVNASMRALDRLDVSLSTYSAGGMLIDIQPIPSLISEDPDDRASEMAEEAKSVMDRIVIKVAEVDTDIEMEIIHQLIEQAISSILRGQTPQVDNYWLQKALDFVHKTTQTMIRLIGEEELADYLYSCVEKVIKQDVQDINQMLLEKVYDVAALNQSVDQELDGFLEVYEKADPSPDVKDTINELFDGAHHSIGSAYDKFTDTADKASWIGGKVSEIATLIRSFWPDPKVTAFAVGLDVVVITYVTWEGYDYLDQWGEGFYNRKDGVVEEALGALGEACRMLEQDETLLTYCKYVSVGDGPWVSVKPGEEIKASQLDSIKVWYQVSWPDDLLIPMIITPELEVKIWELPAVIFEPLSTSGSVSDPAWDFKVSPFQTVNLEPRQIFTIGSLPACLDTTIQEGSFNATLADWPKFSATMDESDFAYLLLLIIMCGVMLSHQSRFSTSRRA